MIQVDWWSWTCANCEWKAKWSLSDDRSQLAAEKIVRSHIESHQQPARVEMIDPLRALVTQIKLVELYASKVTMYGPADQLRDSIARAAAYAAELDALPTTPAMIEKDEDDYFDQLSEIIEKHPIRRVRGELDALLSAPVVSECEEISEREKAAIDLLKRLYGWDTMDLPNSDGAYWRGEIMKVVAPIVPPTAEDIAWAQAGLTGSAPVGSPPQEKSMNMPVWKCLTCGCLWRDNLDETVSLLNSEQKSCASCEHTPTQKACAIHWLQVKVASAPRGGGETRPSLEDEDSETRVDGERLSGGQDLPHPATGDK